ncbi:NAD(P)-binding protein [Melanomma pulvis-pyrius CBS 109.77]|uniref:D-xylose 1-dehydrogenase (NADP(+), D-xylono-1,5-lactone-forming) n=1 Tax=Melanomma pulvis-pyrius CBS 109.77 TaxID=1314802 RepID=A0A6A6WX29_9PLEO|nr:NAD(P)-binding protein [Melanomma pulvis-pyrius CBS 109.77]
MTDSAITTRWGILATGGIAKLFTMDLLLDSKTRGVSDIVHEVVAIGSSSSVESAQRFAKDVGAPGAKCYGTYGDLAKDLNVDIIYVASPHSHHYHNVKMCLENGKNVLCEKPFTMNAKQAMALANLSREKKVFLMEATWIRFFPLTMRIQEIIQSGAIGRVQRVFADHGRELIDQNTPSSSRFVDMNLGAGGFVDLGLYSLTWAFLPLYHWKPNGERRSPSVAGSMILNEQYGFDEHSTAVLTWKDAVAVATSSVTSTSDRIEDGAVGPATKIIGTKGIITIPSPSYRPVEFSLHVDEAVTKFRFPIPGHGMFWEADSAARCLARGELENKIMPLDETIEVLRVMDQLREIGGLNYPESIEVVD